MHGLHMAIALSVPLALEPVVGLSMTHQKLTRLHNNLFFVQL